MSHTNCLSRSFRSVTRIQVTGIVSQNAKQEKIDISMPNNIMHHLCLRRYVSEWFTIILRKIVCNDKNINFEASHLRSFIFLHALEFLHDFIETTEFMLAGITVLCARLPLI